MPSKRPSTEMPYPYVWRPGEGVNGACLERMRDQFRRPAKPMGEAWFMGDQRRMFDLLLNNLDELSLEELREPLEEIAGGNSSFGPLDEWTVWFRYLVAQLIPRHSDRSFDSLYQHLVAAFIAVNPRGIDEVYPGFSDDALQTLGRCLMDPSRWVGEELAVSAPEDPFAGGRHEAFEWHVACGDFSAGMFFCSKYLDEKYLDAWLESVFAIRCPLWTTQLYSWLSEADPLLTGSVLELAKLKPNPSSNVVWHGAHVLKGDYSGVHEPSPSPVPLLSRARCEAIRVATREHVTEAKYFAWLDAIKPHAYLQKELGAIPSRFAEILEIG